MYEQKHLALAVDGWFLRIPNWVLREMGVLQHEVSLQDGVLRAGDRALAVGADVAAPGSLRLGDLAYASEGAVIDLGVLLARPALWLGNEALRRFLGDEAFLALAAQRRKGGGEFRLDPRIWDGPPPERQAGPARAGGPARGQLPLDPRRRRAAAGRAAGGAARHRPPAARPDGGPPEQARLSRALLRRAADAPDEDVRRRAFRVLLPDEEPALTLETLGSFLDRMEAMALRDEDLADLGERGLSDAQVLRLLDYLASDRRQRAALRPLRPEAAHRRDAARSPPPPSPTRPASRGCGCRWRG